MHGPYNIKSDTKYEELYIIQFALNLGI
jgi:hypothetical protein